MWPFSRLQRELTVAVFDIGSSSVGGILFQHHPNKLPKVLTSARFSTDFLPDLDFQKIQRSLHKTFERTIAALKRRMPKDWKRPDATIIIFSSPYYISQNKVIRFSKPKPFEITEKILEEIVVDEIESFKKKWETEHQPVEILEQEEMKINLNGYQIKKPIGKHALSAEISLHMSLGIKVIQDRLRECIAHSFGAMPLLFRSFPFVAFNTLKDIVDISRDLLVIDISGEITDLMKIKDGILEEVISFPFGENILVRRIASAFNFSLAESSVLLRQYIRDALHAGTKEKVRKIIEDASGKWCQFFKDAVKNSAEFSYLPSDLLFIGGKGALAIKDFATCAKEQPFTSRFLLPEAFKSRFIFRKGFSEDKDISLMISSLYADKLFLEKQPWQNL